MLLTGDWAPGPVRPILPQHGTLVLANLEGPVLPPSHTFSSLSKAGPSLSARQLPNPDSHFLFSLANNHLMDYGLPGLESTLRLLDQAGFQACGAGSSVREARQPTVVHDNGADVGIIACCEAQFGVARGHQPGVAEFGPWVYRIIRDLHETMDAVIISVHAAVEDSPWPSPYIRDLYRSYIDAGAAVVHGHHAHIPQGYETHGDGVIFYGMGNFAVNPDRWRDYPNGMWSLAAEVDFATRPVRWDPVTLEIRHEPGARTIVIEPSSADEREHHEQYLAMCNLPFADNDLFEGLWQETALRVYHHRGARYMGWSFPPRQPQRTGIRSYLSGIKRAMTHDRPAVPPPSQSDHLRWYHMVACESHRQMLATALAVLGGEIGDLRNAQTKQLADEMMPWSRGVTCGCDVFS